MKVAINGFGRIGKLVLRNLLKMEEIEVVAINDLADAKTLAHLYKYDSTQGRVSEKVEYKNGKIHIGDFSIPMFGERDPNDLPWKKLDVDAVIECTGVFRTKDKAKQHLEAGAKKILLSAPGKGKGFKTIVLGVNEDIIDADDKYLSNASCTTNCLTPVVKVLNDNYSIKRGMMTTVHGYTTSQKILDMPASDIRRARAAALNIIPTSTGAAKALGLVMPEMEGVIQATALRVPIATGSLIELTVELGRDVSAEEINAAMKSASEGRLKGALEYCTDPIVSSDIIGNPAASIFDSLLTTSANGLVKVVSWYDNEGGYAARLAELARYISKM